MKIFVTGASGFVGRALVLRLLRDKHEVTVWARSIPRARAALGAEVAIVEGTHDLATLQGALEGQDAVINLAGEPIFQGRWTEKKKQEISESRLRLTKMLADAIASMETKPKVFVSGSAIGYYGDRGDAVLDETSHLGEGFLAELCAHWEHAARQAEPFTRVVLVRIGLVLGLEGGVMSKLLLPFKAGLGAKLGNGKQFMSWIHIQDLVEIFARAITDEKMSGVYNGTAPHPVTNAQFTKTLGKVVRRPAVFFAPSPVLKLALGEAAEALLGGQRVLPVRLERLGFEFRFRMLEDALIDLVESEDLVKIARVREVPKSSYLDARKPHHVLEQTLVVDAPIEDVFRFFSRAENLGAMTPPAMSFEIASGKHEIREGAVLDYRISLGPLPMKWRTVIDRFEPTSIFVDSQTRGPYRAWWHEHRFIADGQRTIMEDRVYYAVPLGLLGKIANRFLVSPMLKRIFGFRASVAVMRFGAAHS